METLPEFVGDDHRNTPGAAGGAIGEAAGVDVVAAGEGPRAPERAVGGVRRWRRRVTTLVAFVVLVAVGREIRPEASRAAMPETGTIELGTLLSRTARLEIAVRRGEVRYRVIDGDGKVLAADLNEAELAARFPRLDLRKLRAQQLMLAEPSDER